MRAMNILAIDTCLGALSVAIGRHHDDGSYCVIEACEERTTGHAERLVPLIAEQMARAELSFRDLSRVALTLGPGTFTGVRTGIAAARAFRLTAGVEVVGVSSLAAMAHRIFETSAPEQEARPLLVAVDARRGRLYAQVFAGNALASVSGPREMTAGEAVAMARSHNARIAGSGAAAMQAAAPADAGIEIVCDRLEPHASDLVRLAPCLTPLAEIDPIYIRPPDAKPQVARRLARTP